MKLLPLPKIDLIQHRLTIEQKLGENLREHDELIDRLNRVYDEVKKHRRNLRRLNEQPEMFLRNLYYERDIESKQIEMFGCAAEIDNHKFYRHE